MKINKKKVMVSALAVAMGAALVGSISGTIAWYQYSTRATAAYIGTAAHCSEMLQISADGGTTWKQELTSADIQSAIDSNNSGKEGAAIIGSKLAPVTSGQLAETAAMPTLYQNPVYQYASMTDWKVADAAQFVTFNLKLRVLDVDGKTNVTTLAKPIKLADVTIANNSANAEGADLSSAIRVHVSGKVGSGAATNMLLARGANSTDATVSLDTFGKLDLNKNGVVDKSVGYEWDTRTDVEYGKVEEGTGVTNKQVAYNTLKKGGDTGLTNDASTTLVGGTVLGTTTASDVLDVTVNIWIEGWAQLNTTKVKANADSTSETVDVPAQWDAAKYIGAKFNVGLRFVTEQHTNAE